MPRTKQARKTRRSTQSDAGPVDVDAQRAAKRQRILADLRRMPSLRALDESVLSNAIGWHFAERLAERPYVESCLLPLLQQLGQNITYESFCRRPVLQVIDYITERLLLPQLRLHVGYEHVSTATAKYVIHPTVAGERGFDGLRSMVTQPYALCLSVNSTVQSASYLEQCPLQMLRREDTAFGGATLQSVAAKYERLGLPTPQLIYKLAFLRCVAPLVIPLQGPLYNIAQLDGFEGLGFQVARSLTHNKNGQRQHQNLPTQQFDKLLSEAYVQRCVIPFLSQLPYYTHVTAMEDVQALRGDGKRVGVNFAMHVVGSIIFLPMLKNETRFANLTSETMRHVRHGVQPELNWYESMRRILQDAGRVPFVGDGEVYQVALPAFYTERKQHAGNAVQMLIERVRSM